MGLVMILLWIVDRSGAHREIRFDGTGANWERMAMAWVARGIRQPEKRGPASDEVLFWKNEKREKSVEEQEYQISLAGNTLFLISEKIPVQQRQKKPMDRRLYPAPEGRIWIPVGNRDI